MDALNTGLNAGKFATFWMFPKRFYEAVSLKAFHSISDSTKRLPYIFTNNTTIHPNNEIAVRMRKLFILPPFPAFHCRTTVSG